MSKASERAKVQFFRPRARVEGAKIIVELPAIYVELPVASVRPPSPKDYDIQNLTPRERDVFHLMRQGKVAKELAVGLNISISSAKQHISRVYAKLGCQTFAEFLYKFGERQD